MAGKNKSIIFASAMKRQVRTYHIMMVVAQVVALMVWFVYMTQVVLQLNYNDCIKGTDKLLFARYPAEAYDTFREDENVMSVTALGKVINAKVYGDRGSCLSDLREVMPSGLGALQLNMTVGTDHFLPTDSDGVLIPSSMARVLYESTDVVGKELKWRKQGALSLVKKEKIVGVFADLPANCEVSNVVYKVKTYTKEEALFTLTYYLRIHNISKLQTKGNIHYEQFRRVGEGRLSIRSLFGKGNNTDHATHIFFALLICSSFVIIIVFLGNLCTAIAEVPSLMKTYNTQMILGTSKREIKGKLIMRYVLMSVAAFVLAVVLIGLTHHDAPLWMVAAMLVIASLTGIITGIYPAYYATHQPLTIVTRGQYAVSRKGRWLRMIMLCIMFAMTFVVLTYFIVVSVYARTVTIEDAGTKYFYEIHFANQMAVFAASCLFLNALYLTSIAIIERKYMLHSMQILHIIGMTRGEMLMMKIRHYAWLILIGALVGSPFAWMLAKHWIIMQ